MKNVNDLAAKMQAMLDTLEGVKDDADEMVKSLADRVGDERDALVDALESIAPDIDADDDEVDYRSLYLKQRTLIALVVVDLTRAVDEFVPRDEFDGGFDLPGFRADFASDLTREL